MTLTTFTFEDILTELGSIGPYIVVGLLVLMPVIFLWYLIASFWSGKSVVTTIVKDNWGEPVEADQSYFLPCASMLMKATATVTVIRSVDDKSILDSYLTELTFELKTVIEPDTGQLLMMNYTSSVFASDELKICTDASGLLQNLSSETEDRISAIVAQVGEVTKTILEPPQGAGARGFERDAEVTETKSVQTLQFTNSFAIRSEEINTGEFERDWTIRVDGVSTGDNAVVDAGFKCKIPGAGSIADLTGGDKGYQGVLTRPIRKVTMSITTKDKDTTEFKEDPSVQYDIQIPDVAKVIKVPIKRFAFVKNQYVPKFSSGLLIENYIRKPSEFEGFLSIPINILKAIVSIPAELFHFRITRLQEQTTLETERQNLAKALRAAASNNPPTNAAAAPGQQNPPPGQGGNQAQSGNQAQGGNQGQQKPVQDQPAAAQTYPNLGKLPADPGKMPDIPARALDLQAGAVFDAPPAVACWYDKIGVNSWNSYQNETIPDCVPAAAAHLIMAWTSYSGTVKVIQPANVIAAYNKAAAAAGANNQGCKIWQFMDSWMTDTGLGGDVIASYVPITKQNIDRLKVGVYYYGGCIAGLLMPKTAQGQNTWSVPPGGITGDGAPGSWCGHAVPIVGYDGTYLYAVSLGQLVKMDYPFYNTYNDESYIAFSETDWCPPAGKSPQGTAYNDLSNRFGNLNA